MTLRGFFVVKDVLVPFLFPMVLFLLVVLPFAHAAEEDLDKIKEPLNRVYSVIQAVVSVVGVIVITFAGFKFMGSGENVQARESAKQMLSFAVIGLMIVWIAPHLVNYLVSP